MALLHAFVTNAAYTEQLGLDDIHEIIKRRHLGLYGHFARLQPEFPMTFVHSACCASSDNTPRQPDRCLPRGRHGIIWLHQVCTDLNLPASDALNLAVDRTSWWALALAARLCAMWWRWYYCIMIRPLKFTNLVCLVLVVFHFASDRQWHSKVGPGPCARIANTGFVWAPNSDGPTCTACLAHPIATPLPTVLTICRDFVLRRRNIVISKTVATCTGFTDLRCASTWSTSFSSWNNCRRSTWWTACSKTLPSCRFSPVFLCQLDRH